MLDPWMRAIYLPETADVNPLTQRHLMMMDQPRAMWPSGEPGGCQSIHLTGVRLVRTEREWQPTTRPGALIPPMQAPLPAISDYGLLGDTRSAALVSRWGSVDWLCWPRFDSPAVFLALLDPERGGSCSLVGEDGEPLRPVSRRYLPGTLVLETILESPGRGRLVVTDYMPVQSETLRPAAARADGAAAAPASRDGGQILRHFECLEGGEVTFQIVVRPSFDYARAQTRGPVVLDDDRTVVFAADRDRPGPEQRTAFTLVARAIPDAAFFLDPDAGAARFHVNLRRGDKAVLVLAGDQADSGLAELRGMEEAQKVRQQTTAAWQEWSGRSTYRGRYSEAVGRSILTLKALTYSPTGAIVAAPTLGLPEAPGGVRNYDYRYAWLRDSGFTVRAFLQCGYHDEARAYLNFVARADREEGRRLPVLYGVQGEPPPEEFQLDALAGYRGARPVSVGNQANEQTQHDVYGETLNALCSYWEMTGETPTEELENSHLQERVRNTVNFVLDHWREPDSGIWEPRIDPKHYFHSKALCWVALDRAAKLGDGPLKLPAEAARWRREAGAIRADYLERGWNARRGAYTQDYGSDDLDAAVLRTVLFGALDAKDERVRATLRAIERELGTGEDGSLCYRYLSDDGMPGREGAFTACAFWAASCRALAGEALRAQEHFEALLARGNDLGLFSEEIDPQTGEALGNFPQGFTHMSIVLGGARIEDALERAGR